MESVETAVVVVSAVESAEIESLEEIPVAAEDPHRFVQPNGAMAAAVLAAGLGSTAMGLTTAMAEIHAIGDALNIYSPVGPLSGKTTVATALFLGCWAALHLAWRGKEVNFAKTWRATLVLVVIGLLGTFPPVFKLVEHLNG